MTLIMCYTLSKNSWTNYDYWPHETMSNKSVNLKKVCPKKKVSILSNTCLGVLCINSSQRGSPITHLMLRLTQFTNKDPQRSLTSPLLDTSIDLTLLILNKDPLKDSPLFNLTSHLTKNFQKIFFPLSLLEFCST